MIKNPALSLAVAAVAAFVEGLVICMITGQALGTAVSAQLPTGPLTTGVILGYAFINKESASIDKYKLVAITGVAALLGWLAYKVFLAV